MRFSDLMGSGDDREPKPSDSAIDAAIAPYLDDHAEVAPSPFADHAVEPVEVAAASAPMAAPAPDLPAPPVVPAGIASFDVATPVDAAPPRRAWQPERPVTGAVETPTAAPDPVAAIATAVADLTPFSDDLLPSRRR
ncbi:MAG TPA: hypothetical protein VH914_18665 [Acidimicrobiia bacterium]|jgi:hypothetical protein|nr:hypothetical protein [Acidimicrobiia bacterium]